MPSDLASSNGNYTVTDEDGYYREEYRKHPAPGSGPKWAVNAEDAAEQWAEARCAQEAEYPEERVAIVTCPDGEKVRTVVTWEAVPVFHARRE